eukprot:1664989-Rhodomonas_salina.2
MHHHTWNFPLTVDQINEMHATDLKLRETLENDDDALVSVASTQPAQQVSEDWGATKKQLRAVAADANTRQLLKRVWDLELSTGTDLGTIAEDVGPSEKL